MPPETAQSLQRVQSVLVYASGALGVLGIASVALVAAAHVDDAYELDHVAGGWMALAQRLDAGTLYPPLFDGTHYGGTRYMPLQILLHAGLAKATGEYLVSGKLLVYGLAALLIALIVVVLRRIGCSAALALGLAGAVLVSPAGFYDATAIRGDVLPAALQLGAVALVAETRSRRGAAGAGGLCALAFLSKTSAVWAPVAIVLWLVRRDRPRLGAFAATALATVAVTFALLELLSSGRFFRNVFGLLLGPGSATDVHGAPDRLLTFLETKAGPVWLLLPLAAFAVMLAAVERRTTPYELGLVVAAGILLVVIADPGADFNHLLDVEVLAVVVVGALWARGIPLLSPAVCAVLVWGLATTYWVDVRSQTRAAAGALFSGDSDSEFAKEPLAGRIGPRDAVLSEDPYVPVSIGRTPVVLDPFMLLRVLARHPDLRAGLLRRIDRREFDKVVLIVPLDPQAGRWRTLHFGPDVATAIARTYRLSGQFGRYWLYVPVR